jgi:hypothetical protein
VTRAGEKSVDGGIVGSPFRASEGGHWRARDELALLSLLVMFAPRCRP